MAFKMKGSPAKLGTIQGTSGHASALKQEKSKTLGLTSKAASLIKKATEGILEEGSHVNLAPTTDVKQSTDVVEGTIKKGDKVSDKSKTKSKKAYGGTKTWGQGQKDSGGTLNQITRDQRAYEKEMKAKNPDWNKREDNKWKLTQNKINKHLGSSVVYDTIPEKKTVKQTDSRGTDIQVVKGIGRKNKKTLTEAQLQSQTTKLGIVQDQIDQAKEKKDKTARDKGQQEKGRILKGGDDEFTGTVVSRAIGGVKEAWNKKQLKMRANKRTKLEKKYKKRKDKGKSTKKLEKRYVKKGGDIEDLTTSPTKNMKTGTYTQGFESTKGKKSMAKPDVRDTPQKEK